MNTSMHSAPVVMVFLKVPRPNQVKTRLAATIGVEEATDIYRIMAESQLRRIPGEFVTEVHYAPAEAADEMRAWLGDEICLVPQSEGNLGVRLTHAFNDAGARRNSPVIAIGADCPTLDAATLQSAVAALRECDVAIGPAVDGGYYLIGMNRPHPQLFTDIAWSTDAVFEATLERIRASGLACELLPVMEDIDDGESLRRFITHTLNSGELSSPAVIPV